MCGIAGIVGSNDPENTSIVERMMQTLELRGPDDEGLWQEGISCLGHRRLSIIDIEGGHQPLAVEREGDVHVIVHNGEIYNYQQLGKQLVRQGIECQTRCDTEVLLRMLIEKQGEDRETAALNTLEGMFAFAWWDVSRQRLLLVRDRLGIKPLYYNHNADGVISFGSSLESVLCNHRIRSTLNSEALGYYFTLGFVPAPMTMYSEICELPAGHILVWEQGEIRIRPYWQVDWYRRFEGDEKEAVYQLNQLLDEVIGDHLVSDVPVGAFLSGGLDSSSVVARARRQAPPDFQTFTISFPDRAYDETEAAKVVAKHIGVRHSVIPMTAISVDEEICRFVLKQIGQPFADSSSLPAYLVSRVASRYVKVVLSGDGGDEAFAGYGHFDWGRRIQRAQLVPRWVRGVGLKILSRMGFAALQRDRIRQWRKGLDYSLSPQETQLLHLVCILTPEELEQLTPVFGEGGPSLNWLRAYIAEGRGMDLIQALTRYLTEINLPGDMCRKLDSMSMAASIEVRVPLLDHRIVEFAHSLPMSMKMQGSVRKVVLRKVMQPELPNEVFHYPKRGFSIPLHKMFDPSFLNFCRRTLCSAESQTIKLFGRENVERILVWNETEKSPVPHIWSIFTLNHVLWMMIQFEIWCEEKGLTIPDEFIFSC